jgi:hypothetical protein
MVEPEYERDEGGGKSAAQHLGVLFIGKIYVLLNLLPVMWHAIIPSLRA